MAINYRCFAESGGELTLAPSVLKWLASLIDAARDVVGEGQGGV